MTEVIENMRAFPDLLQAIGVFGFILYVGAFAAIQSGRLCGNGIIFSINQVVAATCVLISLLGAFNLASFLIQVSYIGIGAFGVFIRRRQASRVRSTRQKTDSVSDAALLPAV